MAQRGGEMQNVGGFPGNLSDILHFSGMLRFFVRRG